MGRAIVIKERMYEEFIIQQGAAGARKEILEAICQIYRDMWIKCSKRLYVCHFTVHLEPRYKNQANDFISGTMQSWRRTLHNRKIKAEYIWASEIGELSCDQHSHFHIFTIVHGKYLQSAMKISEHLNKLISRRLGKDSHVFHINPPQQGNSFRMGKKVTGKLYNLDDAVYWTSYIAKVATKFSPFMQKSFSRSKGFMDGVTPEVKQMLQLTKNNAEWFAWGGSHLNWEKILNFNPSTGKPFTAENGKENYLSCAEALYPYGRVD